MKKIILAIIAGIIPLVLPAASTDFWFRHFSVEDGLSSNSVRAIMQDKYGFFLFCVLCISALMLSGDFRKCRKTPSVNSMGVSCKIRKKPVTIPAQASMFTIFMPLLLPIAQAAPSAFHFPGSASSGFLICPVPVHARHG